MKVVTDGDPAKVCAVLEHLLCDRQAAAELLALHRRAGESADATLEELLAGDGLDAVAVRARPNGDRVTLRWVLVHMIEEYARHAGHADLIRESIDGATDL